MGVLLVLAWVVMVALAAALAAAARVIMEALLLPGRDMQVE
jgi:hypothetical protein